ncbi:hypothetical protein IQ06DRAFT_275963 [Phaeosphaeriaceae sp. SRC1lsM3a]|nr:hypothetical protein IQ06DRAFT_275963 [Stagonospora sp. SRC1lsM3a]
MAAALGAQVRPYRDYLTPVLHSRFNQASRYTLLICYAIACLMGEWDNPLWIWFPIGPTGIRTLLVFLPALIIFVLRVAQWHVGQRQTPTPYDTFRKSLLRKSTLVKLVFYIFSAWLFGEVYIWSRPSSSKLGFTDLGRAHDRVKLNERPLLLRLLFVVLAIVQTVAHIKDDYDSIEVPSLLPKKDREDVTGSVTASRSSPRQALVTKLPGTVTTASIGAVIAFLLGSSAYFFAFRNVIWDYYYSFSRSFISLSKMSKPTGVAPFLPLAWGFVVEGTLLMVLWHFVNQAFDLYIAQEPLKNGQPITTDSKDPNGTLLNGLKSKKDAVKAIAFWELALITDSFPDRRKTIYGELERKKAPTFQQVTDICLAEIKFLITRLNIGLDPSYSPQSAAGPQLPAPAVNLVPQIAKPLNADKQVTAAPPPPNTRWDHIEAATSGIAKLHSSPGNAQQAYGREALNKGLKKAQEGKEQAESFVGTYSNKVTSSIVGRPFRQSLERTVNIVVLGAPYSRISLICNAITALTNLATFSLKQDELGRFHEGIPQIIRLFTTAITKIDEYMAHVPIHWSDFETLKKPEAERKKVPQVEEVRECLREGLERILGSFNEYLTGLEMSKVEIMDAKKAIGVSKGPEMLQAGAAR